MAKIKWGALVTDGRGKIGGQVLSKNKYAAYLRNKVTPVNPNTNAQQNVRSLFAQLAQGWRALSQAQRDQWNLVAPDFTRSNIFGDNVPLSGYNLYMRLNSNLNAISEATISTPPALTEVPGIGGLSVVVDNSSQSVTLSWTSGNTDAAVVHQVFATAALSPGKNFVSSELRQIGLIAAGTASPAVVSADYLAKFGLVGAVGQKVFIQVIPTDDASGIPGTTVAADSLIVA